MHLKKSASFMWCSNALISHKVLVVLPGMLWCYNMFDVNNMRYIHNGYN